jgi:hypothetical protein
MVVDARKEYIFHCGGEAAAMKNIFSFIPVGEKANWSYFTNPLRG